MIRLNKLDEVKICDAYLIVSQVNRCISAALIRLSDMSFTPAGRAILSPTKDTGKRRGRFSPART